VAAGSSLATTVVGFIENVVPEQPASSFRRLDHCTADIPPSHEIQSTISPIIGP